MSKPKGQKIPNNKNRSGGVGTAAKTIKQVLRQLKGGK